MEYKQTLTHTGGEALPAGTILLGRYRIDGLLGQGGFGITYVALDLQLQRPVALKELFPSGYVSRGSDLQTVCVCPGKEESAAHLRMRFEQEAQILMQLQGLEGLVWVSHLFSQNNTAYYVMELLVGEDLSQRLRTGGVMTWPQLMPILGTLMNALEKIHGAGLIHRDISPDNIFLTRDGGVRLIDFGSVRSYQGSDHFTTLIKHGFAPWEQYLTKGNQGPWTDVFSLCATAYFSLTGKCPPRATERRMNDTLIPLERLCPNVPSQVCQAIRKGLAVEIGDRFSSIAQLRKALMVPAPSPPPHAQGAVVCLRGILAGKSWMLPPGAVLRIGRSPDCNVVYPVGAAGISRYHCTIGRTPDGILLVRDDGSTCGTRLVGQGQVLPLAPQKWYRVNGLHVCFGGQEEFAETGR